MSDIFCLTPAPSDTLAADKWVFKTLFLMSHTLHFTLTC